MSSETGPTGGSIDTVESGRVDEGTEDGEVADADPATEDVADLPLAPYPPNLGHPKLHAFRQMRDPLEFTDRAAAVRDMYRVWLPGLGDVTNLAHPDQMKRVLLTERGDFRKSEDFGIAFGDGLLTVEGEEWAQQRKTLQPLFVRESVMGYADTMVDQVQRRVERWEGGQQLDLQGEMTDLTLDVLFDALLGREPPLHGH